MDSGIHTRDREAWFGCSKKMGSLTGCNGGVVSDPKSLFSPWVYGATRRPGICLFLFDDKFPSAISGGAFNLHCTKVAIAPNRFVREPNR